MPAVKMVPIKDESGNVVAQRFGASNEVVASIKANSIEMKSPEGRSVQISKKLTEHFVGKGFEVAAKSGKERT